jgi:hypothetical protein
MKCMYLSILIIGICSWKVVVASDESLSASRDPVISFEVYEQMASKEVSSTVKTPLNSAQYFRESNVPEVTEWYSYKNVLENFRRLRDHRFLIWSRRPQSLRRSSWLYPDDGCYARAALAHYNIYQWDLAVPKKVFAFGNLTVKTKNSPRGAVSWWYHVAPIVEVGSIKYVLDPAIEPGRPLKLAEWLGRMGVASRIKVAICNSGTYGPRSYCGRNTDGVEKTAFRHQQKYLGLEWQRLRNLGRNPLQELGDDPPWDKRFRRVLH